MARQTQGYEGGAVVIYDPSEWRYGLRCMDCSERFQEGEEISKRLVAVDEEQMTTELICVRCALEAALTA